jgi:hypothetical protein
VRAFRWMPICELIEKWRSEEARARRELITVAPVELGVLRRMNQTKERRT